MHDENRTLRDRPKRPGIRTSLVAGTVMMASACGVSLERIRAATGLQPTDLVDLDGWLPEALMPAIWRVIDAELPARPVSLAIASMAPFDLFGPLSHMMRCVPTVGDALDAFARYDFVMGDSLRVRVERGRREASLRFHHPMDAQDGGLMAEMGIATGHRLGLQHGMGHRLVRVDFSHRPNGPIAAYEDFFQTPVRFDCADNAMVLDASSLDAPSCSPDAAMVRFIERHFEALRAQILADAEDAAMLRIREAIAQNAERGEYGADALAGQLGMSLRSVQRIVRARDTSVRALLEAARVGHARRLLGDPRLGVEEVAFLLGYSEARAFRRAFRRWTGQSPVSFRRARRR